MRSQAIRRVAKTILVATAAVLLSAPATYADTPIWSIGGTPSVFADTPIWSISGPTVWVTVTNAGPASEQAVVAVTAVVDGRVVTSSTTFECPASSSVQVPVGFGAPVQSVVSMDVTTGPSASM